MSRRYSGDAKEDAGQIAYEVICNGKSDGWAGSFEALEERQEILRQFNIVYTDDMWGRWEKKR